MSALVMVGLLLGCYTVNHVGVKTHSKARSEKLGVRS